MKKKKMKVIYVEDKLFKSCLTVIGNCSFEEARKYLKKRFDVEVGEQSGGAGKQMQFDVMPYWVIWVKDLSLEIDSVAVLTHEIVHHSTRICETRGLPTYPAIDNLVMDESLAYIVEFYLSEVLNQL